MVFDDADVFGKSANRCVPEELLEGKVEPSLQHAGTHPNAENGVSAQYEVVIINSDAPHTKRFRPDIREYLVDVCARRDESPSRFGLDQIGHGQKFAIDLSIWS